MEGATDHIWMDGEFIPWDEAKVHVLTHSLHYGLGVFEGIRCYETTKGPGIFRLDEHVRRLFDSAKIVGLEISHSKESISEAIQETVLRNELNACYIRPLIWLGYGSMGVNPAGAPVHSMVAVWKWGAYLGEEGIEKGIRVKISSYTSHHPNSYMTKAKTTGNYVVSQLSKMEAVRAGYDEALMLDPEGFVTQGSGENLFLVRDGVLRTPPLQGVLAGITRETVLRIAEELGIPIEISSFARDEIYIADEAFFTGSASEITPIRKIDDHEFSDGKAGELTLKIQELYYNIVRGKNEN